MTEASKPVLPKQDKYLRNRPFLVIQMSARRAGGTETRKARQANTAITYNGPKTEVKGWMDITGNMETFERPSVVDRVNATHLRDASVIIDVINSKVIKSQFTNAEHDDLVNHYLNKYSAEVKEAIDIWLTGLAKAQIAKKAAEVADGTYSLA